MNSYTVSVMPSFQLGRAHQMQAYYIVDRTKREVLVTSHILPEQMLSEYYHIYPVNGDLRSRKIVAIAYCLAEIYTADGQNDYTSIDKYMMEEVIKTFSKSLIGNIDISYELKDGNKTIHVFRDPNIARAAHDKLTEAEPANDYKIYEVRTYTHQESERVL